VEHTLEFAREPKHKPPVGTVTVPAGSKTSDYPVLELPEQAGNQAVQSLHKAGLIHTKLSISQPEDPDEREADAVADHVMSSGNYSAETPCVCESSGEMCEECRQKKAGVIARKSNGIGTAAIRHPAVDHVLRSAGQPLGLASRSFFEPRFGRDFSNVRVHSDRPAADSALSIQVLAYTFGEHVVFGEGHP
jgi:hypothetical protein